MSERLGPWRHIERPVGDWTIHLAEYPDASGAAAWDVLATHESGGEVIGMLRCRDLAVAEREALRLERTIDWPRSATYTGPVDDGAA